MTQQPNPTFYLAILKTAVSATLTQLSGQSPDALRDHFKTNEDVREQAGVWQMEGAAAAALLTAHKAENAAAHRELKKRVLDHLLAQLEQEQETDEALAIELFEELTNPLLRTDPVQLEPFIERMRSLEWETAVFAQKVTFYHAVILRQRGDVDAAIAQFNQLLAEPELDVALNGRSLNSLATCYTIKGQWEQAFASYQASLDHWQAHDNELQGAIVRFNLGIVAYKLRNYDEAIDNLTLAETLFVKHEMTHYVPAVQSELAIVYRDLGDWTQALTILHSLLDHFKSASEAESEGATLLNIGEIQLFQGNLAEAADNLREGISLLQTPTYKVDGELHLGLAQLALGNLDEAEHHFLAAKQLCEEMDRGESVPEILYQLGQLAQKRGDGTAATTYWQTAVSHIEASREPVQGEAIKISLLGRWQQIYEALVLHYAAVGDAAAAFHWAERSRARAFAEAVANNAQDKPVSLVDLQAKLPQDTAVLCTFTTGVLENDVPMLAALPADNPLRPHLLLPAETFCFAITRTTCELKQTKLNPNMFSANSPRGFDVANLLKTAVSTRLYQFLCQFESVDLTDKRLVVVPHGPLHRVPFAAVLAAGLGELPRLTYAPSCTLLKVGGKRPFTPNATLAIGYNGTLGDAQPLRYTETEVRDVVAQLGGEAISGASPKKAQLHDAVSAQQWLHFACHGFFDTAQPLRSYLQTGEDEQLTAEEILTTWQLNARLVVLSACETAVSHILRGDEPMGLIRAFLYAGAEAVLATQWPVDDLATALLMGRFYRTIAAAPDAPLADALLTAQTWLRTATVAQIEALIGEMGLVVENGRFAQHPAPAPFADPIYWAAFQLVG